MAADRAQIITDLEHKYDGFLTGLLESLRNQQFIFEEQRVAHLRMLDSKLVIRHALPYCITEEAFFEIDDSYIPFFTAVILLHTLALTKIDDYYDGGYRTKYPDAKLDVSALAYSLSATHESILSLITKSPDSTQLVGLLNITRFVHARMNKDSTERYDPRYLHVSDDTLNDYLYNSNSRLLGSGYYEVMARASFVQRGKAFPAALHELDTKLRRFRQIIDELEDVRQDLAGGLITLPIIHLLQNSRHPRDVRRIIQASWKADEVIDPDWLDYQFATTHTKQWIYDHAKTIYDEAIAAIDDLPTPRSEGYRKLFDYKRAKLDQLAIN